MMPAISVIVPVYKVEPYLPRCIDSILAQTFTDFELILVDDGSPDNCGKICDEYAAKDSRIRVIHKENGGLSSARNAGLRVAVGNYAMFCDSDDTVEPEWCIELYKCISETPDAWIVCNITRIYSDKKVCILKEDINKNEKIDYTYCDIYLTGLSAYACNKIYSLKKIRDNNISFDETCYFGEDIEFNVKYCKVSNCIRLIKKPLYNYYDNFSGIMRKYRPDLFFLNTKHFKDRLPLIAASELSVFCDRYFYDFITWLDNTMDERNSAPFFKKLKYNDQMMKTKEFKFCVANMRGENDSKLYLSVVKLHNYYIYWIFQKIVKAKQIFSMNRDNK